MKVVVCVKQIPDPNTTGQLDPTTHLLKREGVEVVRSRGGIAARRGTGW
jgi:electron transfer flavoprotein alpha/beta subunit